MPTESTRGKQDRRRRFGRRISGRALDEECPIRIAYNVAIGVQHPGVRVRNLSCDSHDLTVERELLSLLGRPYVRRVKVESRACTVATVEPCIDGERHQCIMQDIRCSCVDDPEWVARLGRGCPSSLDPAVTER